MPLRRRHRFAATIGLIVLTLSTVVAGPASAARGRSYVVGGYYGTWDYSAGIAPSSLPLQRLTHAFFAFVQATPTGCAYGAADDQRALGALVAAKSANPGLKVVVSVGGYGAYSAGFSAAAASGSSRAAFAASCAALVRAAGADGLDVDWEFPVLGGPGYGGTPADPHNFTLLLAALRSALGPAAVLTAAVTANPASVEAIYEPAGMAKYVNWLNVMAYDLNGPWSNTTNFNAPLWYAPGDPSGTEANVDGGISAYRSAGVPASKMVLGIPFYGQAWLGVPDVNHGLWQQATTPLYPVPYSKIVKDYLPTMPRYWQDDASVPWLYSPSTGLFISYDDKESIGAKTRYLSRKRMAGAFTWSLTQDDAAHTLLGAMAKALGR